MNHLSRHQHSNWGPRVRHSRALSFFLSPPPPPPHTHTQTHTKHCACSPRRGHTNVHTLRYTDVGSLTNAHIYTDYVFSHSNPIMTFLSADLLDMLIRGIADCQHNPEVRDGAPQLPHTFQGDRWSLRGWRLQQLNASTAACGYCRMQSTWDSLPSVQIYNREKVQI